ncbi:MAG: helix-turn-helix domain-containing protein [Lachnospiraceae bacterium]|nr:helix-turn-helix domain-containing protein [Lachnospiraceae bacterium]
MKIKRPLPPLQKVTTKQVHNNHIYGFGRHTYEYNESAPALDLQIPPTRSDSQAAERERELKAILDLAREGKTATEISEATGCSKVRISQTINRFAEYGAKLAPEPHKKKKRTVSPTSSVWTEEMVNKLIELHRAGLSFSEIGKELGVSKNSVAPKVRVLVEAGVLKPRTEQFSWSQEDVDRMFQLRAEGKTWGEISDKLGRKITACHNAYSRERAKRKK